MSLGYVIDRISMPTGVSSTAALKDEFMSALKSGDIDMSLHDDAKTFDLVVQMTEKLFEAKA